MVAPELVFPTIRLSSLKRVHFVQLLESEISDGVGVIAEQVWDLFKNQDDSNGGQQTFDHARGQEGGKEPSLGQSQGDLNCPGKNHRQQKAWNEPSDAICAATTAVKPAAGPLTLDCDPLNKPTSIPPTTPAKIPDNNGAPDANATPRHKGRATKKTTRPAITSREMLTGCSAFGDNRDTTLKFSLPLIHGQHIRDTFALMTNQTNIGERLMNVIER